MRNGESSFSLKRVWWDKTYMSEISVATRAAIPARMMVALASLFPVPPPDAPSGMIGKGTVRVKRVVQGKAMALCAARCWC
jgi:hypothetical protein